MGVNDYPTNYEEQEEKRVLLDTNVHQDGEYNHELWKEQHHTLMKSLDYAKGAGYPASVYAAMREDLGYAPRHDADYIANYQASLRETPERNDAGELTNERVVLLALERADRYDAVGVRQTEASIERNDANGWPILRKMQDAATLRETAMDAHQHGDREALLQLDAGFELEIHNVTNAAADRGATYWNNDPPTADTNYVQAGQYVLKRANAYMQDLGNGPFQKPEALQYIADRMSQAYRRDDETAVVKAVMDRRCSELYPEIRHWWADDGTDESVGLSINRIAEAADRMANYAPERCEGQFQKKLDAIIGAGAREELSEACEALSHDLHDVAFTMRYATENNLIEGNRRLQNVADHIEAVRGLLGEPLNHISNESGIRELKHDFETASEYAREGVALAQELPDVSEYDLGGAVRATATEYAMRSFRNMPPEEVGRSGLAHFRMMGMDVDYEERERRKNERREQFAAAFQTALENHLNHLA